MDKELSSINWPTSLSARREMRYDSIALLYNETRHDTFGDQLGFVLACTRTRPHSYDPNVPQGCLHKLEIVASPSLANAKMDITHEVLPGQGSCSELTKVNDNLIVGAFEKSSLISIKNFGMKKTFNCDVRGRSQESSGPWRVTSDDSGQKLACGTNEGHIAIYQVQNDQISFLSRMRAESCLITGLAYLRSDDSNGSQIGVVGENTLVYCSEDGHIGLLDGRCDVGAKINVSKRQTYEPRLSFSALSVMSGSNRNQIFLGTFQGQLMSLDIRNFSQFLFRQDLPEDHGIRRMREVVVKTSESRFRNFLAYTNKTNHIRILDVTASKLDDSWTCDRGSMGCLADFIQVEKRIITCGDDTSIGCWVWNGDK